MVDPVPTIPLRLFLMFLFVSGGLDKVLRHRQLQESISSYRIMPARFVGFAPAAFTAAEWIVGVGMLMSFVHDGVRLWPSGAAALILGLYGMGIAVNLRRGRFDLDCGCSWTHPRVPLSMWHLVRIGPLISGALVLSLPELDRKIYWWEQAGVSCAVACAGMLYLCVEALLANRAVSTVSRA